MRKAPIRDLKTAGVRVRLPADGPGMALLPMVDAGTLCRDAKGDGEAGASLAASGTGVWIGGALGDHFDSIEAVRVT
jgi:hypothetical protein